MVAASKSKSAAKEGSKDVKVTFKKIHKFSDQISFLRLLTHVIDSC